MLNTCQKCDYEWDGKPDAKACPRCKRYDWKNQNKKKKQEKVKDAF